MIIEIAKKHGRTTAQIIFAWHHAHNSIILCQTSNFERLTENISFFDIKLDEADIKAIDALNCGGRLFDPEYIDGYDWNGMPYFS